MHYTAGEVFQARASLRSSRSANSMGKVENFGEFFSCTRRLRVALDGNRGFKTSLILPKRHKQVSQPLLTSGILEGNLFGSVDTLEQEQPQTFYHGRYFDSSDTKNYCEFSFAWCKDACCCERSSEQLRDVFLSVKLGRLDLFMGLVWLVVSVYLVWWQPPIFCLSDNANKKTRHRLCRGVRQFRTTNKTQWAAGSRAFGSRKGRRVVVERVSTTVVRHSWKTTPSSIDMSNVLQLF